MSKNILILSDGTGQGGGVILDEKRSNVYKLYRATRSGPETSIAPDEQIAFYDPGLGSSRDNEHIRFGLWRKIYNALAQAMGLGITRNIIDCYAFIIQHWHEGDRVYLYGFSRGAYTARCVGGVMAYCGIPTMENNKPIKRDAKTARRIAEEAVIKVYQHGVGRKQERFALQRKELAAEFRKKYQSEIKPKNVEKGWSNAVPYFIGVWDTVAALGASLPKMIVLGLVLTGFVFSMFALTYFALVFFGLLSPSIGYLKWSLIGTSISFVLALASYAFTHIRCAPELSTPWWKTIHRRAWKMQFYDTYLNPRVQYAKHALSIDENRHDFKRVEWTDHSKSHRQKTQNWFQQMWFPGVHSDVGGSYLETESRLSDIALSWMVKCSKSAKHPVLFDEHYLRMYPDAKGVQHDERKGKFPWKFGLRDIPNNAALHPSVIERFEAGAVVHFDEVTEYRPVALETHDEVKHFFKKD
ncbi:DUF2235 domain-containing protein [Amylibacter sp. SFDW26]|uniref:DUF2235 domain-containing protein n=1 Tax=Amylibacter sp. SFDW26 TaxID=2652722 RepID=UPI00186A9743|nr:DUF2235 domain-containing protein [Amylibacter sp. SFDW26]